MLGEQGWRSGESARLPPMCPGCDSRTRVICGLSLLLVLYSALRGCSPGTPVFPSPQKPTFPNFNSILEITDISERVLVTPWCSVGKQITYLHILQVEKRQKQTHEALSTSTVIARCRGRQKPAFAPKC